MVTEHVVELRLTDTEIAPGVGPHDSEVWSATVTLTLPAAPDVTVSARGRAMGLRDLTAAFRRDFDRATPLGRALRDLLLPEAVEDALFDGCLGSFRPDGDTLLVRVFCENPVFTALPWELTHTRFPRRSPGGSVRRLQLVNSDFSCVLSRVVGPGAAPGKRERLHALVVNAASAHGELHAPDGTYLGTVNQVSQETSGDAGWAAETTEFHLRSLGPVTRLEAADRKRLSQELSNTAHVVCFIAHGWADTPETSGIVLHGSESTSPDLLPARQLARLLRTAGSQLVVLVSCNTAGAMEGFEGWGNTAEQLVASGIPAVVAMQSEVESDAGHQFLTSLVQGLESHGEIHAAVAAGLKSVWDLKLEGYLGVPALYTSPRGLRLVDAPTSVTPGAPHAYPVGLTGPLPAGDQQHPPECHFATDDRRERLDVVWGLERRPFAGVLLDGTWNDLAEDLNEWERRWDEALRARGLRPRRWFPTNVERPPRGKEWQRLAAPTEGRWNDFSRDFNGGADDGWVIKVALPNEGLTSESLQTLMEPWYVQLHDKHGALSHSLIVVLNADDASAIGTEGPTSLFEIRDALERRLSIPVTALSRHRPGRPREADLTAPKGAPANQLEAEGTTESALKEIRRTDPAKYQQLLARLARHHELPAHRAALVVAADYDDDVRTWVRSMLEEGSPLPTPRALPLAMKSERADAIVLSLIRLRAPHHVDLSAWDIPSLSPPVRALLRQYRSAWATAQPTSEEVSNWLSANPGSAMAAKRADLNWSTAEALRRLPPASPPWPLIRAAGVDAEALEVLLGLPMEQRRAMGLVNADHALPPYGFEAKLLAEEIQSRLGRRTTIFHPSSPGEAGQ